MERKPVSIAAKKRDSTIYIVELTRSPRWAFACLTARIFLEVSRA